MIKLETLKKLEGAKTVKDIASELNITLGSARNLLTKLKKEQHATKWILKGYYYITPRKQLPRQKGMYDWINKYSKMKINEAYDHQVHGNYGPEDAIVDAMKSESYRLIMASMYLFNHVNDWKYLYHKAQKENVWQEIGALYEVARMHFKTRRIPKKYAKPLFKERKALVKRFKTFEEIYFPIRDKWNVEIPFRKGDIIKVKYDNT